MKQLSVAIIILVLLLGGISCGKSEPRTTLPDATPPLITNVLASNISGTAVTITWTTDEPATSQAEYGKTTGYGLTTALDEDLSTSHSVTLADLEPNTIYHFRVKSKDEASNDAISEDKTFTTLSLPDTTPPVITEVNVSNIAESSATIIWTTDEPATSQVEYGTTTSYGSASILEQTLVVSHSVTLSGLQPNTPYHFRVKSKDKGANEVVSGDFTFVTSKQPTEVGGILSSNTIWSEENSPYSVINTVQIPSGVTLTIEPGVTITMPSSGDMFLLNGTISAHGTSDNKIVFDGGGNSNFFCAKGSSADTFLDLEYCIIKNGISFWPATGHEQYGYFSLRHCELTNLMGYSYIWYPGRDIHIEYNRFMNAGGFSIGHSGDVTVYIQYNLFDTKNPSLPTYANFWIQNWASYDSSETIVKYNSFINTEGIALELPSGYDAAAMTASENYWGTQDTGVIDTMIYDKNDDITSADYIDYLPILTEPHPSTPSLE